MILKNTSKYDTAELRELIKFAARGIGHKHVELHIRNSSYNLYGLRGRCFSRPFGYRIKVTSTEITNLITAKLPKNMPNNTWSGIRISKLWPDGIPFDNWKDAALFVLAHEFRHVWQNKRTKRTGKRGKREYDAEKFAFIRLNKWREKTGRQPVPPRKLPNPFKEEQWSSTECDTAIESVAVVSKKTDATVSSTSPSTPRQEPTA
jgi:hypothetical protein